MTNTRWIWLFAISPFFTFQLGCSSIKLTQNRPLDGQDVSRHSLADGQVELRLKVSELTSNVWLTTEIINNSASPLSFNSENLISVENTTCLVNFHFEKSLTGSLNPSERVQLRYSYQDKGKQKYSDLYEECRSVPLRFKVSGLSLGDQSVAPIQLTVVD